MADKPAASTAPPPTPAPPRPAYPPPAGSPTQIGPDGVRFDFNQGCRVRLPIRAEGSWRVRLSDLDTDNILFSSENKGAFVYSAKRWYVRFRIEIWSRDREDAPERLVLTHDHDVAGQDVLIQFPVGTLGDTMAWISYAARFAERHPRARVTCAMSGLIIPVLRDAYPDLDFIDRVLAVAS